MSTSEGELLDLTPIQEFVEQELWLLKQERSQKDSRIKTRISTCERTLKSSIEEDIPETIRILQENVSLSKQLSLKRDTMMQKLDTYLKEIDLGIEELEKNGDDSETKRLLDDLQKMKQRVLENRTQILTSMNAQINILDTSRKETLEFSRAIIRDTITVAKQTIEMDKETAINLKAEKERLKISHRQLGYFAAKKAAATATAVPITSIPGPK